MKKVGVRIVEIGLVRDYISRRRRARRMVLLAVALLLAVVCFFKWRGQLPDGVAYPDPVCDRCGRVEDCQGICENEGEGE